MVSQKSKMIPIIGNAWLDATIWVVFEFVMSIIYGVILIFCGHFITGANKQFFYQRVPNLHTETACYADSLHPMIHIKAWDDQIKKRGHWYGFITFYGLQVIAGIAAYWIQRTFIRNANSEYDPVTGVHNYISEGALSTSILHHQVISFFLCTSLEVWTGDAWTKASGVAKSFFLIFVSWILWLFKREVYQTFTSDMTKPYMNNFHVVYSIITSIVLVNLMWCNILSPMNWDKMKGCKRGWERFGTFGSCICLAGLLQWLVMYGIAYVVFPDVRGYFIETAEGAWTLLCYSWYGLTIVGAHISPHLWPALDKKFENNSVVWVLYLLICLIFGVAFSAILYYIYVYFLDPVFVQNVIGASNEGIHDFGRPGYLFAFGAANIPYTYQMIKQYVLDHEEVHDTGYCVEPSERTSREAEPLDEDRDTVTVSMAVASREE